jgi:hypothetical protein
VGHLLDALKRFENLDVRRVAEITFELARLRGNPLTEARGHGEKFSLGTPTSSSASATLCEDSKETPQNPIPQNTVPILAFAGFKRIAPDQDTGMDLNEPSLTALGLFNAGK